MADSFRTLMGSAAPKAIGQMIVAIPVALAVAAVTMALMFLISLGAFSSGPEGVKATLRQALADGSLNKTRTHAPVLWRKSSGFGEAIYRHDCLIWLDLIAPLPDAMSRALHNVRLEALASQDNRAPENADCQAVAQALTATSHQPKMVQYDRYIVGQRAIAQLLLSHFSVSTAAAIVRFATLAAFALLFGVAWIKGSPVFGAIAAVFLLFYDLRHFGSMVYFAPTDITHAVFLLFVMCRPLNTLAPISLAVLGATYGAVIAVFEFLTGGIPLAIALLCICVAISAASIPSLLRRLGIMVVGFVVAAVGCFAIKLLLISAVSSSNAFADNLPALVHRLNGSIVAESNPALLAHVKSIVDDRFFALSLLFYAYANWSRLIGWGSPVIGCAVVLTGFALLVLSSITAIRRGDNAQNTVSITGCWLALLVLVAWVFVFWNHTLLHYFFMARLLVIPVLCGTVAAVETYRARSKPAQRISA